MAVSYFYVKSGGTCANDDGRVGTSRTGTWTATTTLYYDSIYDLFSGVPTTAPIDGDIIICSHLHAKAHTVNRVLGINVNVLIYSVDNANQENYLKGAAETATAGDDLTIMGSTVNKRVKSIGVDYTAGDFMIICNGENQTVLFEDCTAGTTATGGTDRIRLSSYKDGTAVYFKNVTVTLGATAHTIDTSNSDFYWTGGSLDTANAYLFDLAGGGGRSIFLENLDLTGLTSAVSKLLGLTGSDGTHLMVRRCLLASGVVIDDSSTPVALNAEIIGESVGIGSATDDLFVSIYRNYYADVDTETTIIKTGDALYDGINEQTLEIDTNANANVFTPLRYNIFNGNIDTDDYTTDITFKVHCARNNGTLLQDNEFWIEIEYPDGQDNALGVVVDTRGDMLSGSNITDETGGWEGLTGSEGTGHHVMSSSTGAITIGSSTGNIASGPIRAFCNIAVASDTVFVCPELDIS